MFTDFSWKIIILHDLAAKSVHQFTSKQEVKQRYHGALKQ